MTQEARRSRYLIIIAVALVVILVATNIAWYASYLSLQSKYNEEERRLTNMTSYAIASAKLLNSTVKLLKAYQNLTSYLNATLHAAMAERSLQAVNSSLELNLIAVKTFDVAVNLTVEANVSPFARYELSRAASQAANVTVEAVKAIGFIGAEIGANSTFRGYVSQAEGAAENLSAIAESLQNGPDPGLQGQLTQLTTTFLESLLRAEQYIIALARSQSTS
ncbi:MAG: hypothetical protein RXR09_05345 [Acidilobus sp.]